MDTFLLKPQEDSSTDEVTAAAGTRGDPAVQGRSGQRIVSIS